MPHTRAAPISDSIHVAYSASRHGQRHSSVGSRPAVRQGRHTRSYASEADMWRLTPNIAFFVNVALTGLGSKYDEQLADDDDNEGR